MSGIGIGAGINGHQHPLPFKSALEDDLLILQQNRAEVSVAEGFATLMGGGASADPFGQVRFLRRIKARAKGMVPLSLLPLAPHSLP